VGQHQIVCSAPETSEFAAGAPADFVGIDVDPLVCEHVSRIP
jgi:hypothetical protein